MGDNIMGWWSANKNNGQSFKEWATKKYTFEDDNIKHTVLDVGVVNFHEVYMACERISKKDGVKYTYCLVALVRKDSYSELMVKEMDETMGPYYHNCPKKIMNLLSPVRKLRVMGRSYSNAKDWRKTVLANHEKKAIIKNLVYGKTIKFNRLINFRQDGNDIKFDTFKMVEPKKMVFRAMGENGFLVKLNRQFMKDNAWKILN